MNKIASLLFVLLLLFCVRSTSAQTQFYGTVVDVIDGKTVVIELPEGQMKVVLQYVDVPESEQQLHQTVIDHLSQLTRGRRAQFRLVGIGAGDVSGKLLIDGVDISQQMLRDGAAWLLPAEVTGQSQAEYAAYKKSEDAAKADHIGVWLIKDLKPAWVVRAEREARLREQEEANRLSRPVGSLLGPYQTMSRPDTSSTGVLAAFDKESWFNTFVGDNGQAPGLRYFDDPGHKFRVAYTSAGLVDLAAGAGKQRLDCRTGAVWELTPTGAVGPTYLIGFIAISDDYTFSKRIPRLVIVADGRAISLAFHHGLRGRQSFGAGELFFFHANRATLGRIANASNVQIRLNNFSGSLGKAARDLIKQLLAGT